MLRHDWTKTEIMQFYELPFADLIYKAQTLHRENFDPNQVQISTLMNFKTGRCPEDCAYCPQSAHYNTGLQDEPLLDTEEILAVAKKAKANGASRFCMGAAWRSPPKKVMPQLKEIIKGVNALGLESCMTLGMLSDDQAADLEEAGLHFYNHNLDTSPEYYKKIISTRQYQDRLDTLARIRRSKIRVCCGGIVGMGETRDDRVTFLQQLSTLPTHPQSVPINQLIPVAGTPLGDEEQFDPIEFVRTIAVARILMPTSVIRLSAGRRAMSHEMQALCFAVGANSIHYGEKLLTTKNSDPDVDRQLFKKLGLKSVNPTAI
ncbi:biotin synthase BioB [Candidiatus Paracoxiella cheracis]|uniref:biotin synthase BioB n=1 Tax=Candidiatus Paracoxiella cheracis TaxID=3405120 RepID=UPI003BF497FB